MRDVNAAEGGALPVAWAVFNDKCSGPLIRATEGEAREKATMDGDRVVPLFTRPVAPSFDAALAALDYQPVDVRDNGTHVYELLGLDDVRAAHAEAVRVAVEAEREACARVDFGPIFDALQDHIIAMRDERMSVLPAPNGLVVCEKDGKPSHIIRMTTRQAVHFIAGRVAAAIRARKEEPRRGDSPERSEEAKS